MRRSSPDPKLLIRTVAAACLASATAACTTRTLEEQSAFDLESLPTRSPSQVAPQILEERGARLDRSIDLVPIGFVAADAATSVPGGTEGATGNACGGGNAGVFSHFAS